VNGRTVRWLMSLTHRPVGAGGGRLVVIRHHRVYADGAIPLYRLGVAASTLAAQLEMLRGLDRAPVTVAEGLERLAEGRSGTWVALSFDDGYADGVRRALPLLATAEARATFFLTAGLIEERRPPWWDVLAHRLERTRAGRLPGQPFGLRLDLPLDGAPNRARALGALLPAFRAPPGRQRALLETLGELLEVGSDPACELATWAEAEALRDAGMEVGAHTLTHPFLSLLGPEAQRREVEGSITLIERRLGVRPRGLAYPAGDHDDDSVAAAGSAGLAYAVTTRAGDVRPGTFRLALPRRGLSDGACLGPGGRFSRRLARAELDGAFDGVRGVPVTP